MGTTDRAIAGLVCFPEGLGNRSELVALHIGAIGDTSYCLAVDGSVSWGLGLEAASRTVEEFALCVRGLAEVNLETLASLAEQTALRVGRQIRGGEDADSFFSAMLLTFGSGLLGWAWAGDLLLAIASDSGLSWVNAPNDGAAELGRDVSPVSARPAKWYPGLLGGTREQTVDQPLERAQKPVHLAEGEIALMVSSDIWAEVGAVGIGAALASISSERKKPHCVAEAVMEYVNARSPRGLRLVVAVG